MFKKLIKWAKPQYKDLPWRKKRTLYRTLVSEIMLQQTTVGTVLGKFEDFLSEFPNLKTLARATEDEVTIAWKGLGFYRRARNLKSAAEIIVSDHGGKIPEDYDTLIGIKGIGAYTAGALLSIGLDRPGLAVDANLERVLSRIYGIKLEKGPKLQKEIHALLETADFKKKMRGLSYRDLNESIMDLGRVICIANSPKCLLCPISSDCTAYKQNRVKDYPVKNLVKKEEFDLALLRILIRKKDSVLVYKKDRDQWLSGQWEVPTFILSTADRKFKQYPWWDKKKLAHKDLPCIKTGITKYKIQNYILTMTPNQFKKIGKDFKDSEFLKLDLKKQNFATSTLKILKNQELI